MQTALLHDDHVRTVPNPIVRWRSFALALLVIGFVWLTVLPLMSLLPAVSEHIATQKRLGIDPSAMFYTELEITPQIANHVEHLHDAHSAKFWTISPVDSK